MNTGQKIRAFRTIKWKGKKVGVLAKEMGKSTAYVSNYEHNLRPAVKEETLKEFAKALGVHHEALRGDIHDIEVQLQRIFSIFMEYDGELISAEDYKKKVESELLDKLKKDHPEWSEELTEYESDLDFNKDHEYPVEFNEGIDDLFFLAFPCMTEVFSQWYEEYLKYTYNDREVEKEDNRQLQLKHFKENRDAFLLWMASYGVGTEHYESLKPLKHRDEAMKRIEDLSNDSE